MPQTRPERRTLLVDYSVYVRTRKRHQHPRPEPLDSNEVTVVGVMTGLWTVALVVLLLLGDRLPPDKHWWIWVCIAGIGGGLLALIYVRKRRRGIEKRRTTLG